MMAADLFIDVQQLKNSLPKNAVKHKIVNEITIKLRKGQYSQNQIDEFLTLNVILDSPSIIKRLYVNFLIQIKNYEVITKSLLTEDDEIIEDIIKRCDFFWANEELTVDFFVERIFPKVSYSQRKSILKSLERRMENPNRAKAFFDRLNVLYNFDIGRMFIKHCALDVWINLINQNIYLTEHELLCVFKRRSRDILNYLEKIIELHKLKKTLNKFKQNEYENVFFQLFRLHPEEAFKLMDKKNNIFYWFKKSRKSTKIFIRMFPDFVISDATCMKFNQFVIFKYLTKEQLESFICELFPDENGLQYTTFPHINNNVSSYINLFNKVSDKFDMIQKCYKRLYGKELLEDKSKITFDLLTWLDDCDMRHTIALEKFESGESNSRIKAVEWIPYMKIDVSIPKLKELARTSMNADDRKQFLNGLIKTCEINKDYESLLKILKFFNLKHKNEQLRVRADFLLHLTSVFGSKLSDLSPEHWEEIYIMLCNFDIKSELCETPHNISQDTFVEALKYSTKDKSLFQKWFNIFQKWSDDSWRFSSTLNCVNMKIIFIWASEYVNKNNRCSLMDCYLEYNKRNPKDPIALTDYAWILDVFKLQIDIASNFYEMIAVIDHLERNEHIAKHFSESIIKLKKSVLRNCDVTRYLDRVIKYMSFDPDYIPIIIPKICDEFISNLKKGISFKTKRKTLKGLKQVPGLEKLLHQKCYEILRNEKTDQLKEDALWIVCSQMSSSEFFHLIKPYYPKEKNAEMGSNENQYKFMFQKRIAYSLINYKSSADTMDALKAFCYGDFLQITVGSLNGICLKIPYYKSKEFLEKSINSPVSFKKHIIRLLCTILEKSLLITLLKKSWINDKNPAIRKILLDKMLVYLKNDFDNYVWWVIIQQCIEELNNKDKDIIETLANFNGIPKRYISHYCELIWKKLLELEKETPQFKQTRNEMLNQMTINTDYLEDKFMEHLLEENLFNINVDTIVTNNYFQIAIKYMLSRRGAEADSKRRVAFIIAKLKTAFDKCWNLYNPNKNIYSIRSVISNFIYKIFYETIIVKEKKFISLIIPDFVESLKTIFDPEIYFYSYYMYFEFVLIYFNVDKNLFEFGKEIRNIIDREIEKYESIAVNQLSNNLETFLNWVSSGYEIENADLIDGILNEPLQSIGCALTGHFLTNLKEIIPAHQKRKFNEILLKTNDKRIKLYLNDNINITYLNS